jgi:hypothetical protein
MASGVRGSFESNRAQVESRIRDGLRGNLRAAILVWHRSLVQTMSGSRQGRLYRVPGTGAFYRASRPGEPPAAPTGDTRGSYSTELVSNTEARLGSPLDVALWLERGTPRMLPRPAIQPAFDRVQTSIVALMTRRLD